MLRIFSFMLVSIVVSGCAIKVPSLGKQATQESIDYKAVFHKYADLGQKYHTQAQQGNAIAQYNLGYLYRNVAKDNQQAYTWYMKSATQGYAKAQNNLAILYAGESGIPQDFKRAYMWFNISFANGYEEAIKGKYMLQSRMTNADKMTAQNMALSCVQSKYQKC